MSYFSVGRRFHCIWFQRLISNADRNFPNLKKVGPTMFDVAAQDSESFEEQNPKNKWD